MFALVTILNNLDSSLVFYIKITYNLLQYLLIILSVNVQWIKRLYSMINTSVTNEMIMLEIVF